MHLKYSFFKFRERLLLAVQVTSEYSYGCRNYYPLQVNFRDAEAVKDWFHRNKRQNLPLKVERTVKTFFQQLGQLDPRLAWQAAAELVGHVDPGRTLEQLSGVLHLTVTEIRLRQLLIIDRWIHFILHSQNSILRPLLKGLRINQISSSARSTFGLVTRGVNVRQVARQRSLKLSTVKEHLLTVAILSPGFPYRLFLSPKLLRTLKQVYSGNPDYWNFDRFQIATGSSLDFFNFRLYQIMRSKENE